MQQSTKIIGPALGGLLVAVTSPRVAFGVDAATFLAVGRDPRADAPDRRPAAPRRRARARKRTEEEEPGYWAELREGLAYIAARRALVLCIAGFGATLFLLFCFDTLSPLAFQELGVSKALFGLAIAGIGAGGVLGTIAVGRYGGDVNPFVLLGGGTAIVGGCVALMGLALVSDLGLPPWFWTPVLVVVGVASAGILVASPTIIQKETPPELMGRVSTSATSIPTGLQMLAPIAGAALAEWQSVGFVFADRRRRARRPRRRPAGRAGARRASASSSRPPPRSRTRPHRFTQLRQTASSSLPRRPSWPVRRRSMAGRRASGRNPTRRHIMSNADKLRDAGVGVPDGGDDAVNTLSAEEVDSLIAIKAKLDGTDEVAGHARARSRATAIVVW